ncbi:hypothetical protein [Nocardioides sp. AE5]|uniref:LpxL/LpxP family acyltransferase n=1 Tax=Nocardioides sp. AE5 TaxID=2962573 RepID=UPI00288245DC|nr:hypothetical protein [Nocardioides sp. AE5]MDT0202565.1 hypothetical protein [Nocardioides sp. AE5]
MGARDQLQQVRRLVPASRLPGMVADKVDKLWADPAYRELNEAPMRFLLARTDRAGEVPELARKYAEHAMMRRWMRWKPHLITRQEIRGTEHIDRSRPVILNFMHHHQFDGLFGSLKRVGVECHVLVLDAAMQPDAPIDIRQHVNVVRRGGPLVSTAGGSQAVIDAMAPGVVMAMASDVPGQTEVEFLGQRVRGSFGAARIAALTDSQVVVATAERGGDAPYVQLHAPLEPGDFADPKDLLDAMLRLHEPAILAWPEALEDPGSRFGKLDEVV